MTEETQELLAALALQYPEGNAVREVCEAIGADGLTAPNRQAAEALLTTLPPGTARKHLLQALNEAGA